MDPMFDLTDKVAVITGGSRGLGREMVLAFAQRGAHVVIASRKHEACETLAAQVRQHSDRRALAYGCHVGKWDELDGLVDAAYGEFGRVDILVNNAGMSPLYPTPTSITEELFDKVFAINARAPFRLAALMGERMVRDGGGSIINVSSTASIRPEGSVIPYAGAKAALNAMTIALADAYAPSVRVNAILPGPFRTDIADHWTDEMRAGPGVPLRRIGEPHEIIGAALYLASSASSFTTGALLRVDGGVTRTP
jgi:NAD(P)-dependent dehydrogenase (short-subunit alcohol dehydrogenase family)